MRNQLDIFDHDLARMAAANRAAAERALHDVQFTATVRQERHDYYVGEAERWEHLAAHSARDHRTQRTPRMTTDKNPNAPADPKRGGGQKTRLPRFRRLAQARLRSGHSPVTLVRQGDLTKIVGEVSYIFSELLRLAPNPPVKRAPEFEDVISNAFVPTNVPRDSVGLARYGIREKNPPLTGNAQHRSALSHSRNNVAGEIGTEGNKVHHRLRVKERRDLGYLLVLPRRNVPVRTARNQHRSSDMKLLDGEAICKDLRQNLCLSPSSATVQDKRKHSDQECYERSDSSSNCSNRIPIPCAPCDLADLDDDAHSRIPLWTGRHSAMPVRRAENFHG